MADIPQIHQGKTPFRRHFIQEWMEYRQLSVADMIEALDVDKSQVYRWLKGQLPQPAMQARIAAVLAIEPEALTRDPYDDWIRRYMKNRTDEERRRIVQAMELMFPMTGTKN